MAKKKAKKKGRPEKINGCAALILKGITAGLPLKRAAKAAGVSYQAMRNWIHRGEQETSGPYFDFVACIKRAGAEAEREALLLIKKTAKRNWTAAAWWLERKFPQRWARKDYMAIQGMMKNLNANVDLGMEGKQLKTTEELLAENQIIAAEINRLLGHDTMVVEGNGQSTNGKHEGG